MEHIEWGTPSETALGHKKHHGYIFSNCEGKARDAEFDIVELREDSLRVRVKFVMDIHAANLKEAKEIARKTYDNLRNLADK